MWLEFAKYIESYNFRKVLNMQKLEFQKKKDRKEENKKRKERRRGEEKKRRNKLVFNKDSDKEHEIFDKQIQYEEQTMKNFETYYGKPEEQKKDDKQSEEEIKEIQRAETTQKKHINENDIIKEEEIKEEPKKEEEKPIQEENKPKEEEHKEEPKEEIQEENIKEEPIKDEQIESIPKNNFTNINPDNYTISFFTKSFNEFDKEYQDYFTQIPKNQKTTFNISSNSSTFSEGINPKILYCYANNDSSTLIGLCGVSFRHPINNSTKLNITHISAITDDWPSIFKAFITFIQSNFKYNEINLLFYYKINDNNSYEINKEIMNLFKDEFKFKWSKIENHSDEMRRQEMILLSEKNSNTEQGDNIGTMNLKLNSLITLSEGEAQLEQNEFSYQYMNLFLAGFAVNSLKQKEYELSTTQEENNKLINWDTDGIKVYLTCEEFTNDTTNDFNVVKDKLSEEDLDKPSKDGGFRSRKFDVAIQIDEFGDEDGDLTMSGSFLGKGDPIEGTVTISDGKVTFKEGFEDKTLEFEYTATGSITNISVDGIKYDNTHNKFINIPLKVTTFTFKDGSNTKTATLGQSWTVA